MNEDTGKALDFQQLISLRQKSVHLSQFFHEHLRKHLLTMRPLLAPGRVLGSFVGSKQNPPGAADIFARLKDEFKEVSHKPFGLRPQLDDDSLTAMESHLELYPWEYSHQLESGRSVTVTSPVRWVLAYKSHSSLAHMRGMLQGRDQRNSEAIRRFVLEALVLNIVLEKHPGIIDLLSDLRYRVTIERSPDLGALPLVCISASLPAFLPSDDLILQATQFSGVSAFIEVIDPKKLEGLRDPFCEKIAEALAGDG